VPRDFKTQAGGLIAAACFGAGSASLGIPAVVGIPLLVVGGSVTGWVVFKLVREARTRDTVRRLISAAFDRLDAVEYGPPLAKPEDALDFIDRECEWVRAALGDVEATLLRDVSRQTPVMRFEGTGMGTTAVRDNAATALRGYRTNLSDLSRRLASLDLESDFNPREWEDRPGPGPNRGCLSSHRRPRS
jgi:hypothetical protein